MFQHPQKPAALPLISQPAQRRQSLIHHISSAEDDVVLPCMIILECGSQVRHFWRVFGDDFEHFSQSALHFALHLIKAHGMYAHASMNDAGLHQFGYFAGRCIEVEIRLVSVVEVIEALAFHLQTNSRLVVSDDVIDFEKYARTFLHGWFWFRGFWLGWFWLSLRL